MRIMHVAVSDGQGIEYSCLSSVHESFGIIFRCGYCQFGIIASERSGWRPFCHHCRSMLLHAFESSPGGFINHHVSAEELLTRTSLLQ